jgi:hypothetical protein
MIIAVFIAFREQNKPEKNVYVIIIALSIFMYGLMRISKKTPSKDKDDEHI